MGFRTGRFPGHDESGDPEDAERDPDGGQRVSEGELPSLSREDQYAREDRRDRCTRVAAAYEGLAFRLAKPRHESRLGIITKRRILYWLAAMVAVLVVGTTIGLIWADTSDVAGLIAVVTNLVGGLGIVLLLIALGVVTWRQRQAA